MDDDFPIGVTCDRGQWTITECLAGEAARGQFRVRSRTGTGLLTTAPKQQSTIDALYRRFTSAAPGVADLRYIGPLETSYARYDGLIEDEPAGGPLRGRAIDAATACSIVAEACDAVARAHATGFVLGGLRPELVYVDDAAHVTGLAPRCEPFLMTATPPCSGVPHCFDYVYMAPEMLALSPPTAASDVFSLAAILAELVAGEHPFAGDDPMQQLIAVGGNRRRPWRGPEHLRAVIDRGLDPDPGRRPAVDELASVLRG